MYTRSILSSWRACEKIYSEVNKATYLDKSTNWDKLKWNGTHLMTLCMRDTNEVSLCRPLRWHVRMAHDIHIGWGKWFCTCVASSLLLIPVYDTCYTSREFFYQPTKKLHKVPPPAVGFGAEVTRRQVYVIWYLLKPDTVTLSVLRPVM